MSRAGKKAIEGLECAAEYARTRRAVLDWIRDDTPLAIKMTILPEHVDKLIDRICGSKTTVVNVKR
jgi:hypothetical protein